MHVLDPPEKHISRCPVSQHQKQPCTERSRWEDNRGSERLRSCTGGAEDPAWKERRWGGGRTWEVEAQTPPEAPETGTPRTSQGRPRARSRGAWSTQHTAVKFHHSGSSVPGDNGNKSPPRIVGIRSHSDLSVVTLEAGAGWSIRAQEGTPTPNSIPSSLATRRLPKGTAHTRTPRRTCTRGWETAKRKAWALGHRGSSGETGRLSQADAKPRRAGGRRRLRENWAGGVPLRGALRRSRAPTALLRRSGKTW